MKVMNYEKSEKHTTDGNSLCMIILLMTPVATKHDRLSDTCSDTVSEHGSTGNTRHVNITENCQLMTLFNN